ncbi:hypothetical protein COOONC_11402 [Cooperia oncophora]
MKTEMVIGDRRMLRLKIEVMVLQKCHEQTDPNCKQHFVADIKPQNYAVGLAEQQNMVYMLDFGIARKYTVGDTKEVKLPRAKVSFLGTVRFASRACHKNLEQGRKDDLESWIFMLYEEKR